ncbi:MAG TPA: sigma-54 dependent transcriptional regulator [Candidatus Polarisedimenticolia bacterium]|nr:sigma-54 dependent transcriptional regulator [Candidatus Polarisedimenticolia bacterium]
MNAEALPRLLLVEGDPVLRRQIAALPSPRFDVLQAESWPRGMELLRDEPVDVVVVRLLDRGEDLSLVETVRRSSPGAVVVGLIDEPDPALLARAAAAGVHDTVTSPADPRLLALVLERALRHGRLEAEVRRLRAELTRRFDLRGIKGTSPAMQDVRSAARRAAESSSAVLLKGEPGTGRGLIARVIHHNSPRRGGPFVSFHCAAFPGRLALQELFGAGRHQGRVAQAGGGTLLLQEIGSLEVECQQRILERMDTGRGGQDGLPADVRLMAAADADLEAQAARGRIHPELLQRLSAAVIELPPLRRRREDVPLLADHFLERACAENGRPPMTFSPDALACLSAHRWPGNLRELEHLVEGLALAARSASITARDLPAALRQHAPEIPALRAALPDGGVVLEKSVAQYERALLADALERSAGKKKEAADLLGLNRDQMKYLCRKHGL